MIAADDKELFRVNGASIANEIFPPSVHRILFVALGMRVGAEASEYENGVRFFSIQLAPCLVSEVELGQRAFVNLKVVFLLVFEQLVAF